MHYTILAHGDGARRLAGGRAKGATWAGGGPSSAMVVTGGLSVRAGDGRRGRVIRMSGGRAILVWGDFMADYEGMIAEITTVKGHNGDAISAYFARPLGPGPFPGVVLIHHAPGWDEWYREATRKFAHHGYLAISPNLYEREGSGSADDVAAAVRAAGGVADEQAVGDIVGSMQFLRGAAADERQGWGVRHMLGRTTGLPGRMRGRIQSGCAVRCHRELLGRTRGDDRR